MRLIYHLVPPAAWHTAPAEPYRAASLDTEGFIHCANADQVAWAANKFLAAESELLVLVIDPARLTHPLKDESSGTTELFPHVYGPLNRDAVIEARRLGRDERGRWTFSP
jgi:uncharacterized protein (DUF952 family)